MKRTLFKTLAAAGAAALLLSGCGLVGGDDDSGDDTGNGDGGGNAVYDAMTTWDACEVLNNLQPITDYMGIEGYGSLSSGGNLVPSTAKIGNTWDPDAIGCNDLIYLGKNAGVGGNGELKVKIVPTENEEQATAAYTDRVATAESAAAQWDDVKSEEFADPWDQGTIVSWTGDTSNPNVEVIAQDGQWLFHIQLYHTQDYGLRGGGDPALAFTTDELNQWFVDTYLPEVNQIVNDRIVEVQ
ncbi:hypothetical protein AB0B28_09175 [Glycomyces sp. NPDC046736]|uniref:hypothetical protein n=1 Tax=Glycomyces sp. NPDC046736 TaxID=3155615 RepID=UPI0033EEC934